MLSILVPCLNEQATIHGLLEAIGRQDYPMDRLETIVADGGSTDGTRQVIELYRTLHPEHRVIVIENRNSIIPSGLNRAIEASSGDILMRLDGHSQPGPGYLNTCVRLLEEGKGDMVGGGLEIIPRNDSWSARCIAVAVSNPVGVGDSHFRFSKQAQMVDTIAFCAYRREWIERIGKYDETLLSNEDYEFNSRLRKAGGRIWFDPSLRAQYYPPATFKALHRQYWRYGYWKAKMAKRFPETLRLRQFLPPFALLLGFLLLILGAFVLLCWQILFGFCCAYALLLTVVGVQQSITRRDPGIAVGIPLAIATMHFSWATAFLWSLPQKS